MHRLHFSRPPVNDLAVTGRKFMPGGRCNFEKIGSYCEEEVCSFRPPRFFQGRESRTHDPLTLCSTQNYKWCTTVLFGEKKPEALIHWQQKLSFEKF